MYMTPLRVGLKTAIQKKPILFQLDIIGITKMLPEQFTWMLDSAAGRRLLVGANAMGLVKSCIGTLKSSIPVPPCLCENPFLFNLKPET